MSATARAQLARSAMCRSTAVLSPADSRPTTNPASALSLGQEDETGGGMGAQQRVRMVDAAATSCPDGPARLLPEETLVVQEAMDAAGALTGASLKAATDTVRSANAALLERELAARFAAGQCAWPGVALGPEAFGRYLAERVHEGNLPDETLATDLFIACACAVGAPGALVAFEQTFGDLMSRAASRVDAAPSFVDEAVQVLREKLFVPRPDAQPQIAGYAGRAPLPSWLAAATLRTALKLRRRKDDQPHDSLRSGMGAMTDNPELNYIRERYGRPFDDAIRSAVRRLPDKDRALLRLHLAEGMGIDKLGALYHVGRSTAARWLAKARTTLLEETRRELCEGLGLTPSEYESLAAAVRSHLEISLPGCFDAP
jgi:RNA polymerase sigma-70 factor (ECF subfamily)